MIPSFSVYLDFSHFTSIIERLIDSESEGDNIVKAIYKIKSVTNNARIIYYYDSREISKIIKEIEVLGGIHFGAFGNKLRVALGTSSIDVSSEKDIDRQCCYVLWNSSDYSFTYGDLLPAILKSMANLEDKKRCILSFGDVLFTESNKVHLLIDSHMGIDYPQLRSYAYFDSLEAISSWLYRETVPSFYLDNRDLFRPTNYIYKPSKQRVYQRISDRSYWYFDYYHRDNKSHFEVFTHTGVHMGEADMSGIVDTSKQDLNKRASFLV